MAIPNARQPVPPPLPPPQFLHDLDVDLAYEFANNEGPGTGFVKSSFGSVNPASSLCGSGSSFSLKDARPPFTRQGSSSSTVKASSVDDDARNGRPGHADEGYSSLCSVGVTSPKSVCDILLLIHGRSNFARLSV